MTEGDPANCWLFEPNENAFLCYAVKKHRILTRIYQRENKRWKFVIFNPAVVGLQRVENQETAALLDEMEKTVFLSAK